MEVLGFTVGVGALAAGGAALVVALWLLDGAMIQLAARITGTEELRGFGHALGLALAALVAYVVVGLPVNAALGCVIGSISGGLGWIAALVVQLAIRGFVFARLLASDFGSGAALALVSTVLSWIVTAVLWGALLACAMVLGVGLGAVYGS